MMFFATQYYLLLIILNLNSLPIFLQTEKHSKMHSKIRKMMGKEITIDDLPTEIIQDYLFKYLHDTDIYNLSQTGSMRLKEVSENFIQLGK